MQEKRGTKDQKEWVLIRQSVRNDPNRLSFWAPGRQEIIFHWRGEGGGGGWTSLEMSLL